MVAWRKRALGTRCTGGIFGIVIVAGFLGGCASSKNPDRLYDPAAETAVIRSDVDADMAAIKGMEKKDARRKRNQIIAERKYAIDLQYTQYETALTHEAQATDFAAKAATIALGTTADLVPVEHTARLLGGI